MKSFKEYIDWEKETGYRKSTSKPGSGGKGGWTEPTKGERAMIHWTDDKNRKNSTMIPPVQYHGSKDTKTLKKYVDDFKKDVIAKGGKVQKVDMDAGSS